MTDERATSPDQPMPLGDLLAYHARRDPDRPAVTQNGEAISRGELERRANRRARLLASNGVGEGDFVVIALPNGIEFFETTFALWKLGAVPCPVSAKLPDIELAAIVDLVAPKLVIGPDASRVPGWPTLPAGAAPGPEHGAQPLASKVSPHWKALTSGGSTGRPKVIVTTAAGTASPHGGGYLRQRPEETILNPGPLYHNAAFSAAHQCLFAGGHVINMEKFDAEQALQLIQQHKVGHVVLVPTMMNRIWRLPVDRREAYDMSSLDLVVHLGAACPVWLKQDWIEWLGSERVFEVYAGTEGIGSTSISGTEWLAHKGSVGRAGPGAEIRILSESGAACEPGTVGEIFFRQAPDRFANSYYIGATANDRDGWASLGDLGYLDADGYLYLADRRTDMIVSGGVNIYPAEVEAALDRHPSVRSSVVVGLPDEDLGSRVHAIVQIVPEMQAQLAQPEIVDFLEHQLVRYKIPRSFEFVTDDLRDESGKVRRTQLREDRIQRAKDPAVG